MEIQSTDLFTPIDHLDSVYALARHTHFGCLRDA